MKYKAKIEVELDSKNKVVGVTAIAISPKGNQIAAIPLTVKTVKKTGDAGATTAAAKKPAAKTKE